MGVRIRVCPNNTKLGGLWKGDLNSLKDQKRVVDGNLGLTFEYWSNAVLMLAPDAQFTMVTDGFSVASLGDTALSLWMDTAQRDKVRLWLGAVATGGQYRKHPYVGGLRSKHELGKQAKIRWANGASLSEIAMDLGIHPTEVELLFGNARTVRDAS